MGLARDLFVHEPIREDRRPVSNERPEGGGGSATIGDRRAAIRRPDVPMTVCLNSTARRDAAVASDGARLCTGRGGCVRGGWLVELVAIADDVALVATDPVHKSVHGLAQ